MTPADRQTIAAMLRERLPEGWRKPHILIDGIVVASDSAEVLIRSNTWRLWVWEPIRLPQDAYTPILGGKGWCTRLVDDIVAAVASI